MSTNKDWQDFEKLITKIQSELTPDAIVKHNQKLKDSVGIIRQIDILISQKIADRDIQIFVECKYPKKSNKPVGLKDMDGFATVLRDLNALGIMVSSTGFTRDAKKQAKKYTIRLLSYIEAQQIDWEQIMGAIAWTSIIFPIFTTDINIRSSFGDEYPSLDTVFYDEAGTELFSLKDIIEFGLEGLETIGDLTYEPKEQMYVKHENVLFPVTEFLIKGKLSIRQYDVNIGFAEGSILKDSFSGKEIYRNVNSQAINWREILGSQNYIEITPEQYKQRLHEQSTVFTFDTRILKPYIRLNISQKI